MGFPDGQKNECHPLYARIVGMFLSLNTSDRNKREKQVVTLSLANKW